MNDNRPRNECRNCGSVIVFEQSDNGGPRWWHEHSGLACCGTADGIQTIAEPVAVTTGGTMGI